MTSNQPVTETGGNSARAVQKKAVAGEVAESASTERVAGFVMPKLEELVGTETTVAKELQHGDETDKAALLEAYQEALKINPMDEIGMSQIGVDLTHQLTKHAHEAMDGIDASQLERIIEIGNETSKVMRENGVSTGQPNIVQRVIHSLFPKKAAQFIDRYVAETKEAAKVLDDRAQTAAQEKAGVLQSIQRMNEGIRKNIDFYRQFSKMIAAFELSYLAHQKHLEEQQKQFQADQAAGTPWSQVRTRELSQLQENLARQARHLNALKQFRQECFIALRNMDMLKSGHVNQVGMIDQQMAFSRLAFANSSAITASAQVMKRANMAVKFQREEAQRLIESRTTAMEQAITDMHAQHKEGVINGAFAVEIAARTAQVNKQMIEEARNLQKIMGEASSTVDKMDGLLRDIAAMDPKALEKLDSPEFNRKKAKEELENEGNKTVH